MQKMHEENSKLESGRADVRYHALIPAAGIGARMGIGYPKQYMQIAGSPVLQHAVNAFLNSPHIDKVFVVVSLEDAYVDECLQSHQRVKVVRRGGATRAETVVNGLQFALESMLAADNDWILVHDAARPGINSALIEKLVLAIDSDQVGGLLAQPVHDTVKQVIEGRVRTIARETLWLAQTPQMFRARYLLDALKRAPNVTDEASAVEFCGDNPILIEGEARNRKLTRPEDLEYLSVILERDAEHPSD